MSCAQTETYNLTSFHYNALLEVPLKKQQGVPLKGIKNVNTKKFIEVIYKHMEIFSSYLNQIE
jgi:hypothetical protein